jgi:hypothetical protein
VWIVGHKPEWVRNVNHVPTIQASRNKYVNATLNWRTALHHPGIADNIVLMNDDFYAMTPGLPATPKHRGTIRQMLDKAKWHNRRNSDYLAQINTCLTYLEDRGVTAPLSYELHIPLPVHRPTAANILATLPDEPDRYGYVKRSIYGNLAGIGGTRMDDPRPLRFGYWEWDWISSNDDSFKPGLKTRVYLEHRFPEPCYYEDARTAPRTKTQAFVNTAPEGGGRIKVLEPTDPKARVLLDSGAWLAV